MQDDNPVAPDKGTLAERIAKRMAEGSTAPAARHEMLSTAPAAIRSAEQSGPSSDDREPPPAKAPSEPPQAAAPTPSIHINFNRLHSAGFLTPTSERTSLTEEFRVIKRQLLKTTFSEDRKRCSNNSNVIMVTSSIPGEGKTFVSLNLAMSFSMERDLYVLLVDADNHRHSLTDLLGVDQQHAGLVDVLADKKLQLRDIIHRTNIPNLSFVPAGRPHPQGAELLSSKEMAATMQDLAMRYPDRIIIIDTPPLMASTEGAVLSSHVGHAVVVVEKDRTAKRSLQHTLELLEGCREISCVFNMDTANDHFLQYAYGY